MVVLQFAAGSIHTKKLCSRRFDWSSRIFHACVRQTDGHTVRIMTPKTAIAYARAVKITRQHYSYMYKDNEVW